MTRDRDHPKPTGCESFKKGNDANTDYFPIVNWETNESYSEHEYSDTYFPNLSMDPDYDLFDLGYPPRSPDDYFHILERDNTLDDIQAYFLRKNGKLSEKLHKFLTKRREENFQKSLKELKSRL